MWVLENNEGKCNMYVYDMNVNEWDGKNCSEQSILPDVKEFYYNNH